MSLIYISTKFDGNSFKIFLTIEFTDGMDESVTKNITSLAEVIYQYLVYIILWYIIGYFTRKKLTA